MVWRYFFCLVSTSSTEQFDAQLALNGINTWDDDQDLFIQLSVDTVHASYAAAKNRVLQYTQLLSLLKHEEELWAQRVEKAKGALPEYKPRWMSHLGA